MPDEKTTEELESRQAILLQPKGANRTHYFNEDIAVYCRDTDCAILFENVLHFIKSSKMYRGNYKQGRYWVNVKHDVFLDCHPYFKNRLKVTRLFNKLVSFNLLLQDNFNDDPYDRTNWYALSDISVQFTGIKNVKPTLKDIHNLKEMNASAKRNFDNPVLFAEPKEEDLRYETPETQATTHCSKMNKGLEAITEATTHCSKMNNGEITPVECSKMNIVYKDNITNIKNTTTMDDPIGIGNIIADKITNGSSITLECINNTRGSDMIDEIDFTPLRKLSFSTPVIEKLERLYAGKPKELQDSIKHLVFDVEVNHRVDKIQCTVQQWFMSIMSRGKGYNAPAGYRQRHPQSRAPQQTARPKPVTPTYHPVKKTLAEFKEMVARFRAEHNNKRD